MPFRIGGFVFGKNKCYKCHRLFIPEFCKTCKRREFGLCYSCHKKDQSHLKAINNA